MRATPILASLAVNAAVLALLGALGHHDRAAAPLPPPMELTIVDVAPPIVTAPVATAPSPAGGGGGVSAKRAVTSARANHASSAWSEVVVHEETGGSAGEGGGTGGGIGGGHGRGIGLGDGGGIGGDPIDVPAPPAPPPPSLARAARLLHPSRETDTDEAELFVARVTVDTDGDVVGAHMLRSHPGSRGDTAASMIFQFRYDPARDDVGKPIRSTFEQKFAVR